MLLELLQSVTIALILMDPMWHYETNNQFIIDWTAARTSEKHPESKSIFKMWIYFGFE